MLRRIATRLIVFQGYAPFLFEGGYDEFLDSIGWAEEQSDGGGKPKKKKQGLSKKDARRQRAQSKQADDQRVAPLKQEVERLEKSINTL